MAVVCCSMNGNTKAHPGIRDIDLSKKKFKIIHLFGHPQVRPPLPPSRHRNHDVNRNDNFYIAESYMFAPVALLVVPLLPF